MIGGLYIKGLNPKVISSYGADLRGLPAELLSNGGFETDLTGWGSFGNHTGARITTDSFAGAACAQVVATGAGAWEDNFRVNYIATIGQTISIEFAAKSVSGNTALTLRGDGDLATPRVLTITSSWQVYRHEMKITGFANSYVAFCLGASGTFNLDAVSIKVATNAGNYFSRTLATTAERTWEAWVNVSLITETYQSIFEFGTNTRLSVVKGATATSPFTVYGNAACATPAVSQSSTVFSVGGMLHIALTYSDSGDKKVRLLVNGVEVSYTTQTAGASTLTNPSTFKYGSAGSSAHLQAVVAEARISNIVRTDAELLDCYKFGIPAVDDPYVVLHVGKIDPVTKDQSINGNNLTATGSPLYTTEAMKSQG